MTRYESPRNGFAVAWQEDEEIDLIVAGLECADGAPVDPAMWQYCLAAMQLTCGGRGGETEPPKGRYSGRNPL